MIESPRLRLIPCELRHFEAGQGLATEVAPGLIDHAFAHPHAKRVDAHTLAERDASTRVLEKVGMRFMERWTTLNTAKYRLGKLGGCLLATLNLALALAVATALILAGGGSTAAAWTVFVLTIPFVAFVPPYFMGVALLEPKDRTERAVDEKAAASKRRERGEATRHAPGPQ